MGTTKPRALVQQASNGNTQLEAVECKPASMTCSPKLGQRSGRLLTFVVKLPFLLVLLRPSFPLQDLCHNDEHPTPGNLVLELQLNYTSLKTMTALMPHQLFWELMPSANGKKNHGLFAKTIQLGYLAVIVSLGLTSHR